LPKRGNSRLPADEVQPFLLALDRQQPINLAQRTRHRLVDLRLLCGVRAASRVARDITRTACTPGVAAIRN
jgi:hypothetical protein